MSLGEIRSFIHSLDVYVSMIENRESLKIETADEILKISSWSLLLWNTLVSCHLTTYLLQQIIFFLSTIHLYKQVENRIKKQSIMSEELKPQEIHISLQNVLWIVGWEAKHYFAALCLAHHHHKYG